MACFHLINKAHRLACLGALAASALWCGNAYAAGATPPVDAQDTAEPTTLRDAVAFMGQIYGFDIVGLDRLGTEAPDWPPTEQPAPAVLKRLLRQYGYVAELKAGQAPADHRLPQRLLVVGPSVDRGDASARPVNPIPATLRRDADGYRGTPSALSRTLGQLALSGHGNVPPAPAKGAASAHVTALSGPGASAASPSTDGEMPDMAALTSTARANLIGLVTNLQNACRGNRC